MTEPAAASDTLDVARHIAVLADERRGSDVVILDVRALVDYTDYFVIVSGQSSRQNQAIAEHVVRTLKGEKRYAISKAGLDTGSWICLDLGSVVVHVFDPETRARYDLELLWSDAPRVSTKAPEPVPAKRRRVTRKAAVVGADAENAPDSERPPEGEPEAPPVKAKAKPRPKARAKSTSAPRSRKPSSSKPPARKPSSSSSSPKPRRKRP